MRPSKRIKASLPKYAEEDSDTQASRDDKIFNEIMRQSSESEPDSDVSEYGKKRKMTKKKTRGKRARKSSAAPPQLPDMSDDDAVLSRRGSPGVGDVIKAREQITPRMSRTAKADAKHNSPALKVKNASANIIQIHVEATPDGGPAIINLDLSTLLKGKHNTVHAITNSSPVTSHSQSSPIHVDFNDYESTLLDDGPEEVIQPRLVLSNTQGKRKDKDQKRELTNFLNLPYEIRIRVYRQVFVTATPIEFTMRNSFQRSSALLRVCKTIHQEGRAVLYGENAFHFERTSARRGAFFEHHWKEIGFKDIRRFLDTIGPINISFMKYVSFLLVDAAPSVTPELDEAERRFVNDPVLHYIFRIIGAHATLSKVGFTFSGRRTVSLADYHFLKAVTSMKCHEFIHTTVWPYHSKANVSLIDKLKTLMIVKRDRADEIDLKKKKRPVVKMWHEKPRSWAYTL